MEKGRDAKKNDADVPFPPLVLPFNLEPAGRAVFFFFLDSERRRLSCCLTLLLDLQCLAALSLYLLIPFFFSAVGVS